MRRGLLFTLVTALLQLALLATSAAAATADAALAFRRDGQTLARLSLASILEACDIEVVEIDDPYYLKPKRFRACPIARILRLGFGETDVRHEHFFLRALDGYSKPAEGRTLLEEGGYLAYEDAERDGSWEPIDRRQVDPGPFYLIWTQPHQRDIHRYPWPYQLSVIEIAPFETAYPHTVPTGAASDDPARRGFDIFRRECVACHALNGEGGRIGPDLNVPRSIVEYRPSEQVKAYIRNPLAFRYTSMPPNPHLSDSDLDAILAYFFAMKDLKRDPGETR